MFAVPAATPVTTPVEAPMDAFVASLLLQVPPAGAALSTVSLPEHVTGVVLKMVFTALMVRELLQVAE